MASGSQLVIRKTHKFYVRGAEMWNNYENDCIHLKACRRMQKIYGHQKSRGCSKECSAYNSLGEVDNILDGIDAQYMSMNPLDFKNSEYGRGVRHGACAVVERITSFIREETQTR